MTIIRPPAVAGAFYPDDPATLAATLDTMLAEVADAGGAAPKTAPKAIIVPHAGYIYSGPVAATVYARLAPLSETIERVVVLGPCHRVAVQGAALSSVAAFATPLGKIDIDHSLDERLLQLSHVATYDEAHSREHSLEVQLPFLQRVLGNFELIPVAVGNASADEVADILECVWGGPETLIVISSDLSHYLDYDNAKTLDGETAKAIEALDPDAISDIQACGRIPVKGLLQVAEKLGLEVETLDLRNSGDTAGPRDQVVGYGAWTFSPPAED